jgi:hypothetical protein
MKLTIETKTTELVEIEVDAPSYRKYEDFMRIIYYKFDKDFVIEIDSNSISTTTYNEYSIKRISKNYQASEKITKIQFYAAFDNLVNLYKAMI